MTGAHFSFTLDRLSAFDWACCLRLNRASRAAWVRSLTGAVSRLGDGLFWVGAVLATVVADGAAALPLAFRALAVGATCYALYTVLKRRTTRPRPYTVSRKILRSADPLDQYSFPSGHTMQAVALTSVIAAAYPLLVWILVPFSVLVALSRVVAGLHYPSDVAAGAALGGLVGLVYLTL